MWAKSGLLEARVGSAGRSGPIWGTAMGDEDEDEEVEKKRRRKRQENLFLEK